MVNNLLLRQATRSDSESLLRIIHSAYAEYHGRLDPPSGAHAETVGSLSRKLHNGYAIIATLEDTFVGSVLFEPRADHLYLGRLAVLPAYRRSGIGSALVNAVETSARTMELSRVVLGVRLQVPANRAFYESLGYHVSSFGCHPGFTLPTFWQMEKWLSRV